MELGEEIIAFRARYRLTQKKMAEICGISPMTLFYIEKGNTCTPVTKYKILQAMEKYEREHID